MLRSPEPGMLRPLRVLKPKTLRGQLVLLPLVVAAMLLSIAFLYLWGQQRQARTQADKSLSDKADAVAEYLFSGAGLGVWDGNAAYFEDELLPTLTLLTKEMDKVAVYKIPPVNDRAGLRAAVERPLAICEQNPDDENTPICEGAEPIDLNKITASTMDQWADRLAQGKTDAGFAFFKDQFGDHAVRVRPIYHKGIDDEKPSLVGAAYVKVHDPTAEARIQKVRLQFGAFAVVVCLLAALAHIALERTVVRPVAALVDSTTRISKSGDYSRRVERTQGAAEENEIATLIDRFNNMIARIEERNAELARANSKLARRRKHLQSEVKARTLDLAQANDKLERTNEDLKLAAEKAEAANRAKSEFLANMNHELRGPLNTIVLKAQLIQRMAKKSGDEAIESNVSEISTVSTYLTSIINQILDLSKVEAGKLEPDPQDIEADAFIKDVRIIAGPLVTRRGNRFEIEVSPDVETLRIDVTYLRQCLVNLIGNGSKFTEHGLVKLMVRRATADEVMERLGEAKARETDRWIAYDVSDTGIGMDPDELRRVFDPFVQAHKGIEREFGGTGLGLPLTRRFCQLLGGDVHMVSEKGVGTVATVLLPERYLGPETSLDDAVRRASLAGADVLIIDDDRHFHDDLGPVFERAGLNTHHAYTAHAGIQLCEKTRPDVVVLDILMPVEDGRTVLNKMKANPELADIPVIVVTEFAKRDEVMPLGAVEFMSKPLDEARISQLIQTIKQFRPDIPIERILIVDDEKVVREALRGALEPLGAELDEARNGTQAIEAIEMAIPDLMLLDLAMPQLDGFETIRQIREHEEWGKIFIIVLTSKDLTRQERNFILGQTDGLIQKQSLAATDDVIAQVRTILAAGQ